MATPRKHDEIQDTEDPFPLSDEHMPSEKIILEGLPAKSFMHPMDLAAALALTQIEGFETVAEALSGDYYEGLQNVKNVSEYVQVGPSQYGDLYQRYLNLASVLSISQIPNLFIMNSPVVKAEVFGTRRFSIRVTSALIDAVDDDELDAILAHELGHFKCDHMRFKMMTAMLDELGGFAATFMPIPGINETLIPSVHLALLEWNRKAKYSCDRAALLAVQDLAPVTGAIAKLAGLSNGIEGSIDVDALLRQADQFHEIKAESPLEKALKLSVLKDQTNPSPIIRLREITQWAGSPQHEAILQNQYGSITEQMWYVAVDRDAVGPMTLQELRDALGAGKYTADDYVFTSGLSDWAQVRTVATLAGCCVKESRSHLPTIPESS